MLRCRDMVHKCNINTAYLMEASDKEKRSLSTYKEKFLTYLCKTWEMIPNCGFVEVNKIV